MTRDLLKVVILTGEETAANGRTIAMLANLPQIELVGIVRESRVRTIKGRLRNLRRNVRREGLSYLCCRVGRFAMTVLEQIAGTVVSQKHVQEVLRASFPEQTFTLSELARRCMIPFVQVEDLNSKASIDTLYKLNGDVGIVLGTGVLKRSTFDVPRLGCINLHKGKVPEYRGMPPGFWELYDGETSAGVTIHFVDDGLDTGDVVGTGSVPVHPKDTPVTLRRKLDQLGDELLARCVVDLASDRCCRTKQIPSSAKPRRSPTRRQRHALEEKLAVSARQPSTAIYFLKTLLYLTIFYSGLFHVVRAMRKRSGTSRACILLYHRVNDLADDELTTSVERFVEHMVTLRRYYCVIPTSVLVDKLRRGETLPDNAVAIHFDDCYRDVYLSASRVLSQFKYSACCFVSSGYLNSERAFPHDKKKCPFPMENLTHQDLLGLAERGFEVGSHTVNHVDLCQCTRDVAKAEVIESRKHLEDIINKRVSLLSYPFGKKCNMSRDVRVLVQEEGYDAMFSAYGGYVTDDSDFFDLPRVGVYSGYRSIDLMMLIEGFSRTSLWQRWKNRSHAGKLQGRTMLRAAESATDV